nr:hypothetical protein B0A51_12848 [Rachicladosporium sp. CCFEE 5018]
MATQGEKDHQLRHRLAELKQRLVMHNQEIASLSASNDESAKKLEAVRVAFEGGQQVASSTPPTATEAKNIELKARLAERDVQRARTLAHVDQQLKERTMELGERAGRVRDLGRLLGDKKRELEEVWAERRNALCTSCRLASAEPRERPESAAHADVHDQEPVQCPKHTALGRSEPALPFVAMSRDVLLDLARISDLGSDISTSALNRLSGLGILRGQTPVPQGASGPLSGRLPRETLGPQIAHGERGGGGATVAITSEPQSLGSPRWLRGQASDKAATSEPRRRGPPPRPSAQETEAVTTPESRRRGPPPRSSAQHHQAAVTSEPRRRGPPPRPAA